MAGPEPRACPVSICGMGRPAKLIGLGHVLRTPGKMPPGSLRAGQDLGGCAGLPILYMGELGPGRRVRVLALALSPRAPQGHSPGWRRRMSASTVGSGLPPGLLLQWVSRRGLPKALALPQPALFLSCCLLS